LKLLLDSCTFLWIIEGGEQLSSDARALFTNPENEVFLSAVSAWEIAQKNAMGKLPTPEPVDRFVRQHRVRHGISPLALDEESVFQLPRLPLHHRDPFDRMLVCQAIAHGLALLTPDPQIAQYPVRVIW
jgi:PIN domain nuclease of toxin-antitoxin system